MIVLGLDPGLATTGYGVLEVLGPDKYKVLEAGTIRTKSGLLLSTRLSQIAEVAQSLLDAHPVTEVAIERLFFVKNVTNGIEVGHARGVLLLTAAKKDLPIYEYRPREVKQAVAGIGNAPKEQVGQMVTKILQLQAVPRPDDTADALAIALTHIFSAKFHKLAGTAGSQI